MNVSAQIFPGIPLVESPLFKRAIDDGVIAEEHLQTARSLSERGYAVIDFPDQELDARSSRLRERLAAPFKADAADPRAGDLRIQDAWKFDDDVKAIATNPDIIDLLGQLYGRPAFPFQTLNFPVGTQQPLHTDAVHFSSVPERFMCGVWVALEDIRPEAGPLMYVPGSHRWPIITNTMIGRVGWGSDLDSAQLPYHDAWEALLVADNLSSEQFLARKGQALIWAANLLHGGCPRLDPSMTRWSQVTHYYFERCIYYTPAFSDEPIGRLQLRQVTNIASGEIEPSTYLSEKIEGPPDSRGGAARWIRKLLR